MTMHTFDVMSLVILTSLKNIHILSTKNFLTKTYIFYYLSEISHTLMIST